MHLCPNTQTHTPSPSENSEAEGAESRAHPPSSLPSGETENLEAVQKTCFKCGLLLPITEFYAHPRMADRHLGKCKNCTKSDSVVHYAKMVKDRIWVEKEIERCRIKSQRRRACGLDKPLTPDKKRAFNQSYVARYPQKYAAKIAVRTAMRAGKILHQPCEQCGSADSEGHHEDYSKPLYVRWLCPKHHAERHRQIRKEKRAAKFAALTP